jgi:hypothetical protein
MDQECVSERTNSLDAFGYGTQHSLVDSRCPPEEDTSYVKPEEIDKSFAAGHFCKLYVGGNTGSRRGAPAWEQI